MIHSLLVLIAIVELASNPVLHMLDVVLVVELHMKNSVGNIDVVESSGQVHRTLLKDTLVDERLETIENVAVVEVENLVDP